MKTVNSKIYEFGKFRVDAPEKILFDGANVIALTPKAFETLLFLIENCGHAVSKDEIMQTVWADSFVEENNLAQNISFLRKVLGDGKDGAKFIETVSKRGYRFIAPVQIVEAAEPDLITVERTRARVIFRETIETDEEPGRRGEEEKRRRGDGEIRRSLTAVNSPIDSSAENAQSVLSPHLPVSSSLLLNSAKPETHYVQNGDVNIAYQTVGHGDLDIVFVMGWVSHLEYFWEEPHFAAFLNRLASFSRLILFDKRGTGLSDRVPIKDLPTLEQRMEDVHAVMDAVGSERAALVGVSEGGPMCSLFAATYPERTAALVMIGSYAKRTWEEDYPWGVSLEDREKFFEMMRRDWGKPVGIEERAPSLANDEAFRNWWATYLRMGASPGAAVALTKMNAEIDVRQVLPTIRVPSLVIHRRGDLCLKVEEGRFVASKIPACKYVELEGIDHLPFVGNQDEILDEIEEFLTGVRHAGDYDRVLATVLNIKIVDAPPAELIENSRNYVSRQIELFKGREISFDETGVLATFDGPARAIRCACAINDSGRRLNIKLKTGLHTGECDVLGETYGGFAVNLAQQIAEQSSVGEILVSRTVKDLVAGSGIVFEEHGVSGEWKLYFVQRQNNG
ncbi:MAG: alpha/beta fold hydrolase [Pyrinomonadaceae bacterium]|nr:alpha/beta fold hydrolase [Pyrinomonadaceae bacterium]